MQFIYNKYIFTKMCIDVLMKSDEIYPKSQQIGGNKAE